MKKTLKAIFIMCVLTTSAMASQHQRIDTLGVSSKGQFVALEEYGYKSLEHTYYVNIRILNVWTKQYVGVPVRVEVPALKPHQLTEARQKAKDLAQGQLTQFKIQNI